MNRHESGRVDESGRGEERRGEERRGEESAVQCSRRRTSGNTRVYDMVWCVVM